MKRLLVDRDVVGQAKDIAASSSSKTRKAGMIGTSDEAGGATMQRPLASASDLNLQPEFRRGFVACAGLTVLYEARGREWVRCSCQ